MTRDVVEARSLLPEHDMLEQLCDDGYALRDVGPTSVALTPEDVIGYDALWDSFEKCRRGVMWKGTVASFYLNATDRIYAMSNQLADGTYKYGNTTKFTVTHPKQRVIVAETFRDRVLNRSIVDNLLVPAIGPTLIYDNAACQKGKGTDFSRERMRRHLARHYRKHGRRGGVLMVDVKGYYDHILHWAAEDMFSRHLPDWGLDMVTSGLRAHYPGDVGYNPGSSVVQIIGVSLLSHIDHIVKDRLRIPCYMRYMDDFRIIHEDVGYLDQVRGVIERELGKIGLAVHPKKTKVLPLDKAIPYLGFDFRLSDTGKVTMLVDGSSPKHMRRKIGRMLKLEAEGKRPCGTARTSYGCWRNHASKGSSKHLIESSDIWFADKQREITCSTSGRSRT